ncbi:hypothetical protein ABIB62_002411 [Mucilaginibacter sp. UYP25]|uniref:hypothetical protein n=1 Tax=unclassified Mucilaginibacter TaxID=2617802 RepID=UPI003395D6C7
MTTYKFHTLNWSAPTATPVSTTALWKSWLTLADSQAPNKTMWFLVSLMLQGVLLLPIPAVLIYYFNAPLAVLAVTMALFFGNIIAGMGGSGIRTLLNFFAASVIIHLAMLIFFIV